MELGSTAEVLLWKVIVSSWFRRIPRILVLHIKRFTPNITKSAYAKSHERIKIDTALNIQKFCSNEMYCPIKTVDAYFSAPQSNQATDDTACKVVNDADLVYEKFMANSTAKLDELLQICQTKDDFLASNENKMGALGNQQS